MLQTHTRIATLG